MLNQHDMYLLDRLARAVQRGTQMSDAQRADLVDFVETTATNGAVRALARRYADGKLLLPELVEAAKGGPFVNLPAYRASLSGPQEYEPVIGILQEPAGLPRLSWWRRILVWLTRRYG